MKTFRKKEEKEHNSKDDWTNPLPVMFRADQSDVSLSVEPVIGSLWLSVGATWQFFFNLKPFIALLSSSFNAKIPSSTDKTVGTSTSTAAWLAVVSLFLITLLRFLVAACSSYFLF